MTRLHGTTGGSPSTPTNATKAKLRNEVAARIHAISDSDRRRLDGAIGGHLLRLSLYRDAEQVIAYVALPDEVSLDGVLRSAVLDGKRIFLPVVCADGGLAFRSWLPGEELCKAALGTLEPSGGEEPALARSICLVPGRAFDLHGRRLGRGRGYYDRVLDGLRRLGPTVGVAYGCQVVGEVPSEPHDRRVAFLVTDRGVVEAVAEPDGADGEDQ